MKAMTLRCYLLPLLLSAVSIHCNDVGMSAQEPIQCISEGRFILPGTCNQYYECKLVRGNFYPNFKDCPQGYNFDDVDGQCLPEGSVTSPLACVQVLAPNTPATDQDYVPLLGSDNVTDIGTELTEDLGSLAQDVNVTNDPFLNETAFMNVTTTAETVIVVELSVCDLVNTIDSYSTLVISNPLLRKSLDYQIHYNRDVENFNRDLEIAQNNTAKWRRDDSIMGGIKRTYQKANEYKGEFERKLKINQKLIQNLAEQKTDPNMDQRLRDEIKALQDEIKETEAALALTDVAAVRQYFEGAIATKRQAIENKQQKIGSGSKVARELAERMGFLQYVKEDASEVEALAMEWQGQMEFFFEALLSDLDAFVNYSNSTSHSIANLTTQEQTIQSNLKENGERQNSLDLEKEALNSRLDVLNAENGQNSKEIYRLTELMGNKTEKYNLKRNAVCQEGGVVSEIAKNNGTLAEFEAACDEYMIQSGIYLDLSEEQAQIQQVRRESSKNRKEITQILEKHESLTLELRDLFEAEPSYHTKLRQIDNELGNLRTYTRDLENLKEGAQATMDSLVGIVDEFTSLLDMFESYSTEIQDMMALGNSAQNDDDRSHAIVSISQGIADMQLNLDQLDFTDTVNCI